MTAVATEREYELVLMLDPEAPEERREAIAADARGRIEAAGELRHDESWGLRKMAYDIEQRTEADYRFYRFRGQRALLDDLDHNLKIADGVLRFRIFKVDPRSPLIAPPDPSAIAARPSRREGGRPDRRGSHPRAEEAEEGGQPEEPAAQAPQTEEAPAPAEQPPEPQAPEPSERD